MRLLNQRVAWVEGSLLEPQHFQQQERYFENALDARFRHLLPFGWGITTLELDTVLLEQGKVALLSASGIFPDGTAFDMPNDAPLPSPCEPGVECAGEEVCLALALDTAGTALVDLAESSRQTRFIAALADIPDRNYGIAPEASPNMASVQVGRLHTRLTLRSATTTGETLLPIARIGDRLGSGALRLDPLFVPPLLDSHGATRIIDVARELLGLLTLRMSALAAPGSAVSRAGNLSDLIELLLVQTLGEYRLQLQHLLGVRPLHPERLYRILLGLYGRLGMLPGAPANIDLPAYDHSAPGLAFRAIAESLRQAMALVIESPAVPLEFRDRGDRIKVCVADPQLRLQKIVFVVTANIPADRLRNDFPAQAKFGPVEKIAQLIDLQLPGARLAPLPVAPRHIPYYPDGTYFEIGTHSPMWDELMASSGLALSVVGDFPGLRVEAWGLRQGRLG